MTLLAVVVLALLSACGGGSGGADQGLAAGPGQSLAGAPGSTATGPVPSMAAMSGMPTAAASTGQAAPVSGNAVAIKNFAFSPAALTVTVGTTVTWTNVDADAHTVTSSGNGGPLKSAALNKGQTFSYTFTTAGTFAYLCTIHPFMTATVKVTT